ncbi:MAG: hypothetical protein ACTSSA_04515 [Candidatus Freyarchaeota archaeon]
MKYFLICTKYLLIENLIKAETNKRYVSGCGLPNKPGRGRIVMKKGRHESNRIASFSFNGDPMFFTQAQVDSGGKCNSQTKEPSQPRKPLSSLYEMVKETGIINCVCKACSTMTRSPKKGAEEQKLQYAIKSTGIQAYPDTKRMDTHLLY